MRSPASRLLITCEHASGALPEGLDLGLSEERLLSHISCDRGSLLIARELARLAAAPLHEGRFSRLLVDLNRREANPAVILAESYGVRVPGNAGLSEAEREARIARWHRPYREAARADAVRIAESGFCLHLSIHSFTPAIDPAVRAFDAGVLFDEARSPEREIAIRIADALRGRGHDTRLNAPYRGTPEGLTSWLREQLDASRYAGLEIEANQAWIDREGAVARFAADLASAIAEGGSPEPLE